MDHDRQAGVATAETVDQVFAWILSEVADAGYLSPRAVFIDGTHIAYTVPFCTSLQRRFINALGEKKWKRQ